MTCSSSIIGGGCAPSSSSTRSRGQQSPRQPPRRRGHRTKYIERRLERHATLVFEGDILVSILIVGPVLSLLLLLMRMIRILCCWWGIVGEIFRSRTAADNEMTSTSSARSITAAGGIIGTTYHRHCHRRRWHSAISISIIIRSIAVQIQSFKCLEFVIVNNSRSDS